MGDYGRTIRPCRGGASMKLRWLSVLMCAVLALAVAACGDDDDGGRSGGSGSATSAEESLTAGAKTIDVKAMDGAKGDVTMCAGKDTTGSKKAIIEAFNQEFAAQGLKAQLLEFS